MTTLATQTPVVKTNFLRRLWQAVLRFEEALNHDAYGDLARRVTDLERQIEASRAPAGTSPPLQQRACSQSSKNRESL